MSKPSRRPRPSCCGAWISLLVALALGAGAPLPCNAQSVSATLTGQVTDPAGSPVPEALVTLRHEETAALRQVFTGADGRYTLGMLRPGHYTLRLEAGGFEPLVQQGVTLPLQGTVTLNLTLATTVLEEVTVTADRPLLDASDTSGGLAVGAREIADLPLSGRVFTDLAMLDASLRPVAPGTFVGERSAVFAANGQGGRSNTFLVDGLDNNDLTVGSRTNSLFSQQVVQEFRVMTDGYAPEFGRASGGVLNILTRSGGNEHEGGFFLQGSSGTFNEEGDFVAPLAPVPDDLETVERLNFGGWASGPMRREKAFYFVAYEEGRSDSLVPFLGLTRDQRDLAEAVIKGALPSPGPGRLPYGGRLLAPDRSQNFFAKFNMIPAPDHQVEVRLSWDEADVHGLNVGGVNTDEWGHTMEEATYQAAASLTSTIGTRWFNEARLLASRSELDQEANSIRPGVDRPSGRYGGNHLQYQGRIEERFQLVDNVSRVHGKHAIKFGMDLQWVKVDIETAFNPNGIFLYTNDDLFEPGDNQLGGIGAVGIDDDGDCYGEGCDQPGTPGAPCDPSHPFCDEFPDFDTYPLVFQLIEGAPQADFDTNLAALFAQDEVRVSETLQLTYGLRYDLNTFELDPAYAIPDGPPNGGAKADRDNIAPRFAFTWTPSRTVLVRGGVGMFYDKVVLGFPAVSAITGQQTLGILPMRSLRIPWNEDTVEERGVDFLRAILVSEPRFSMQFTTGTVLDTPYTVQGNLGVETRVAADTVFSATGVYSRGYHIPLLRDINPVVRFEFLGSPDRKLPVHRYEDLGSISSVETMGNSWYWAFGLGIERREGKARYRFSYVYSRAEDEGSDPLRGGISLPADSDDIPGERGRSDNDQRHRAVFAGTWETPWWGLYVSPVITFATGIPYSIYTTEDSNGDGLVNDRPCERADPDQPCTGENVTSRLERNSGKDTPLDLVNELRRAEGLPTVDKLDEPVFFQVDLRLSKRFRSKETLIEAYLQVFNLFDRVNAGPIDGRIGSRYFGQPLALLGPPRTVEMGVRVDF